ncbi:MAG: class I SAM-dependent methyltransferase, partial [Holophagales bacterium]|nr:class I SAM-dependent methyltransferase [Holophagales bacterium]
RLCHGAREMGLPEYFRRGLTTFRAAESLLAARFGEQGPGSILDFGCGHGRVTRFLAARYGGSRVVAAEADPAGVAFVKRLGVDSVASPIDPAQWRFGRRLPAVLAFSVFTHLPERTFRPWLERLWETVAPGGMLVASVLDEAVLLPGRRMPAPGFHFERTSESRALELDDYGTSWVAEAYFRRALDRLPGLALAERLPLGLWRLQDLWILHRAGGEGDAGASGPAALAQSYRPGPMGFLEEIELSADRRCLELRGWCGDGAGRAATGGARALEVHLELDGREEAAVAATEPRPDLEAEGGGRGFSLACCSPEPFDSRLPVSLRVAEGPAGAGAGLTPFYPLFEGTLDSLELYLRLAELGRLSDRLGAEVAVFEASGFGRLRRRWMGWKRRAGFRPP